MKTVTGQKDRFLTMKDLQGISHFKRTYKAETVEDYAEELKKMNLCDLQREAVKAGTAAISERKRLEKNLLTMYEKAKVTFDMASCGQASGTIISRNESSEREEKRQKALDIGKRFR